MTARGRDDIQKFNDCCRVVPNHLYRSSIPVAELKVKEINWFVTVTNNSIFLYPEIRIEPDFSIQLTEGKL